MTLQEEIKAEIKEALKAHDSIRLDVFRSISAAFTNELVAKGHKPQDALGDEDARAVIVRLAKQRKDSIDQFMRGGREDLVSEEQAQLRVIEKYLPRMMAREEVMKIVENKKSELGITDQTQKGKLMAEVMKELKGKADGMVVKEVVDSLF